MKALVKISFPNFGRTMSAEVSRAIRAALRNFFSPDTTGDDILFQEHINQPYSAALGEWTIVEIKLHNTQNAHVVMEQIASVVKEAVCQCYLEPKDDKSFLIRHHEEQYANKVVVTVSPFPPDTFLSYTTPKPD